MKIASLLLIASFLLILGCTEKKLSPLELATNFVDSYENKSSISYDINYQIKYFSEIDDTTKVSLQIDLIRVPEDSVFGGYVWMDSDSMARYYDTNFLYFIDHRQKSITRFPKEKPYIIKGNTVGETIRTYFLKPQRLINGVTDSTSTIELVDDTLSNRPVWKLSYLFADDEYTENSWKNIWIDKEDFSVPKINYSADMQGENQYNQWDLSNISFDKISITDLKNRFSKFEKDYEFLDYEEPTKEDIEPLANGTAYPNITGINYFDSTQVNLDEFKGQLTLFDFWYMDCFPCIKAIPHLNEMYNKYKDKGFQVVGLNPFNNNEKDKKRFPNFLDNNQMDYPIILIDREDSEKFKVRVYPTFYLVDKAGKVIHSELGFSEAVTGKIDSLVQIHL